METRISLHSWKILWREKQLTKNKTVHIVLVFYSQIQSNEISENNEKIDF